MLRCCIRRVVVKKTLPGGPSINSVKKSSSPYILILILGVDQTPINHASNITAVYT